MSRQLGLIIGVNHYQDPTFQPLQFAENDARALAQWLVNDKGGKWSPPDVQLVQGQYATRELVESLIAQTCLNTAAPDDLVFIYFGGHAFIDERSGEGYLALSNTIYQDSTSGLRLLSFVQYIAARSRAKHILFIIDCFQTGAAWSARRSSPYDAAPLFSPTLQQTLQQQPNRLFFCICRGNENSPEIGEQHLGLFVYRTILGLCGPAKDPAGSITLSQLYSYLARSLGAQYRPQLLGQQQTPLILLGSPQAMTSTAPTPAPARPPQRDYAAAQEAPSINTATAVAQDTPRRTDPLAAAPANPQLQQQIQQALTQAQHSLQAQNYGEAFRLVEQVLQFSPDNTAALILKGQLLGTAGRYQEALEVVEQLARVDPENALAWSMRSVVLTNLGYYQDALSSIERSLEIDATNPEAYAIKTNIMGQVAEMQTRQGSQPINAMIQANDQQQKRSSGPLSFFIGVGIQIASLVIGGAGAVLLVLRPTLPVALSFVLMSLGLALLCVNAARGAFRHGFTRLLLTLLTSLVVVALLGVLYKVGYVSILNELQHHPTLLQPLLFLLLWLAAAALVPLVAAIGGLLGGLFFARGRAG